MAQRIPLARPYFDEEELEAVRRVLDSGWVVQGPEVEAFEAKIGKLHQARHCIAVSSGTAALHLCYLALDIGPGDAVFIPSFAWPSAAHMAKLVGAAPQQGHQSIHLLSLAGESNLQTGFIGLKTSGHIKAIDAEGIVREKIPIHRSGNPHSNKRKLARNSQKIKAAT